MKTIRANLGTNSVEIPRRVGFLLPYNNPIHLFPLKDKIRAISSGFRMGIRI